MKMKQQLGSLLFLKKIILSQLKKFEEFEESKSLADSLYEEDAKVSLREIVFVSKDK